MEAAKLSKVVINRRVYENLFTLLPNYRQLLFCNLMTISFEWFPNLNSQGEENDTLNTPVNNTKELFDTFKNGPHLKNDFSAFPSATGYTCKTWADSKFPE